MNTLAQIAIYVINTFGTLYVSLVLMRFLCQLFRADYYNPISKSLVKFTNPLLIPLRKIIPGLFGIDLASLTLAILLQALLIQLIVLFGGFGFINSLIIFPWAMIRLVDILFSFYYWGTLIMIIGSFVAPYSNNPALSLLRQLIEPVLAPFRKILPPIGVIDLSPMIFFMLLQIFRSLLLPEVAKFFGMPIGLLLGI